MKPAVLLFSRFFLSLAFLSLAFLSLALFSATPSLAEPVSPFLTKNQSPFSLIYGLPLASSATLLKEDQTRWISSLNLSNTINSQTGSNDSLFIDIETWQLNLIYDYGLTDAWTLRLQLPMIAHSGGFMDAPIDAYHQALGLPEGIRPQITHDQIEVNYSQNNIQQLLLNTEQASIGDIFIQFAFQAAHSEQGSTSYWLGVKLPSGDADKLTGSGATDISAWVASNYRLNDTRWVYAQGGVMYMSEGDVLPEIQNNWALFANAGIKFQPWNSIELKAQLDIHSAFYDSEIEFLGDILQLTFGGAYHFNKKHRLDFAVAEDIQQEASPDVNFNISWWVNY